MLFLEDHVAEQFMWNYFRLLLNPKQYITQFSSIKILNQLLLIEVGNLLGRSYLTA